MESAWCRNLCASSWSPNLGSFSGCLVGASPAGTNVNMGSESGVRLGCYSIVGLNLESESGVRLESESRYLYLEYESAVRLESESGKDSGVRNLVWSPNPPLLAPFVCGFPRYLLLRFSMFV